MPRPHSPDCLLWAKNLKDEHIKLKMRMTDLENANEKRAADAKELKSNVDGITALKHDLGDLGKRVGDIEDDDQEFKNLNDGVVEDLKKRIVGQERKLEDLTSKLSSFVRTNDDLQEEQTRLRKSYDNLATDLKKLEKLISKSTSNAGQLARKNDPNDLRTLHSIVESIQHKQIDEIAMIQTLDARMMQLERSGQRMGPPSIPAKTPSVQETSSPAVLVPASPLAQKSARSGVGQSSKASRAMAPPSATLSARSARNKQDRFQIKDVASRNAKEGAVSASTSRSSPLRQAERSPNFRVKRKAESSETTRQTRSQKKLDTPVGPKSAPLQTEPRQEDLVTPSEAGEGTAHPMNAEEPPETSNAGQGVAIRTERRKPHDRRKRRTISQPYELPPLEAFGD